MIVLLNNKREEIHRAVFYCVSQNVNLVEIKHFSYWQKKVTQSPPWGNPPVPPWSHLFHVHENVSLLPHLPFWNCFVILCSNFIYFTRPSNSSDSVISLTDSLNDDLLISSIAFDVIIIFFIVVIFLSFWKVPHFLRFKTTIFLQLFQFTWQVCESRCSSWLPAKNWFLWEERWSLPTSASAQTWQSSCSCWCWAWSAWRGSTSAWRWRSCGGPGWCRRGCARSCSP